jgi:Zn finger protein HypA/HybF involved in hydrogenase expression
MIYILKCLRCLHEWASKKEHPTVCPDCKSPYWNIEKKVKKS